MRGLRVYVKLFKFYNEAAKNIFRLFRKYSIICNIDREYFLPLISMSSNERNGLMCKNKQYSRSSFDHNLRSQKVPKKCDIGKFCTFGNSAFKFWLIQVSQKYVYSLLYIADFRVSLIGNNYSNIIILSFKRATKLQMKL